MFDLDQLAGSLSVRYLICVTNDASTDQKAVETAANTHPSIQQEGIAMNSIHFFAPIAALDFEPIKLKLMHKESGEAWSRAYADTVEFEYRRFLYLVKKFPNEQVAPLFDVDVFWHYHILDTMKYAVDCEQVFGYFLHHCPSTGTEGEEDPTVHDRNGARMQELYEASFGEACLRQQEGKAVTESPAETAWCSPAIALTAWCSPATPKTAWCSPATKTTAWCSPAIQATAWCSPATKKTAWCSPAKTYRPESAAPNDRMWS
jgi:hypothetical protein